MMSLFELVVDAGPHARRNCPVVFEWPSWDAEMFATLGLRTERGDRLPAQTAPSDLPGRAGRVEDVALWTFILPELGAGETLRLRCELEAGPFLPPVPEGVLVEDGGNGSVSISVGEELLTVYRYLGNPARPCFFPLLGPGGKRMTRSWPIESDVPGEPRDHVHHRSMWVAHGEVNKSDNWSEEEGHGFQLHRELLTSMGGPVFGRLVAVNDWTDGEQRKVLEERRVLTAYAIGGEARMFDLEVCFTATECDVRFGDTKEGGIIALRVAPAMDGDHGGRIENSYGAVGEGECWGRRAQWCDYSGEIEGEVLGIAIFDHPHSFRHPTFWHVRDYGMYTANPFGWHDYYSDPAVDGSHLLPRGASLFFHYRVYLHRGNAAQAAVAERYHDYANPPRVELVA